MRLFLLLDGILWVVRTGVPWKDLPTRYPPYQTCHRRFQRKGEGPKIMAIADGSGLSLAVIVASAAQYETRLADDVLSARFLRRLPRIGIELIAPNRSNQRRKTQDGR